MTIYVSGRNPYLEILHQIHKLDVKLTKLGAVEIPREWPHPERVTAVVSGVSPFNSATLGHLE